MPGICPTSVSDVPLTTRDNDIRPLCSWRIVRRIVYRPMSCRPPGRTRSQPARGHAAMLPVPEHGRRPLMRLRHPGLLAAFLMCCASSWAGDVSTYTLDSTAQAKMDYTKIGTLTTLLPVPSESLHGAVIKTVGDLSVRLSGGQVIDFQDETARTLEISGVEVNKIPEILATGKFPEGIPENAKNNLLGLKKALQTNLGAFRPSRIIAKDGNIEAYIFEGEDEEKKVWVTFFTSPRLVNSYTMVISKGFEKKEFDKFLLQGAFGK